MRRAGARALAALAASVLLAGAGLWSAGPAAARQAQTGQGLTMSVVDVSPNTPTVSTKPKPLTFTLELVNHSTGPVDVAVSVSRGDPIGTGAGLDAAIAHPHEPSATGVVPLTANAHVNNLAPGTSERVTLTTTTSTDYQAAVTHHGVCLCANLIYPFWFIGSYIGGTATAQTFVPAFTANPVKDTVSWVWPILDRPHRLLQSRIFFDDALAKEIAGGRLDRLLQVIEGLPRNLPVTIMTDPELIAELAEMEQGYRVSTPQGLKAGTGSDAASVWLSRFRSALASHPHDTVELTPPADPAVDSLTRAGMSWGVALDPREQALVKHALGERTPPSNLAWPVGRSLSPDTLEALAKQGANTVIVSDTSLSNGAVQPVPNALAPAPTTTEAQLAVTSAPIERLVNETLDPAANGLSVLPQLVSQLAVRVVEDVATKTNTGRYVVITPPRLLDVDPTVAVRTIEATADTTWSQPITVEQAAGDNTKMGPSRGTLRDQPRGPRLGHKLVNTLRHVSNQVQPLLSMFDDPTVGARLFSAFPTAIQRCASTSLISSPAIAFAMADRLREIVNRTRSAVYIVRPSDGTYTLTSKSSPLPITVVNRLNSQVKVEISVDPVSGESGLSASSSSQGYTIKANSKVQVHVQTHVDRVGLIRVVVRISTPLGLPLGRRVSLSVRSTALGTIGVIITVLAAILLVVAVVIRQARRLRRRTPRQPEEPTPVAATTASTT